MESRQAFSLALRDMCPDPVIEVDHFEETRAVIDLIDRSGVSELINVAGPTTVHVFFEGINEGDAIDDDGDGFDEVQTEMVSMELRGNSSMGPLIVRLNPSIPSRGEIEERANNTPGTLDIPPFTSTGLANSFFDVFLEVELPDGTVLHGATSKRMSSVITHKPPAPGDFYEDLEDIELLFPNGEPSGFFLGATRHVPRPCY